MKQYSWKFWIIFWSVSAVLLVAWYFFLQWKNNGFRALDSLLGVAPVSQETREDMRALTGLADYVLQKDGKERTFLILFQNNTELRPGGGYIGSFGILKIRDGQRTAFAVHDSNIFDGRIPDTVAPPYPMKETLNIPSWKFRDSNWSPDFPTNAAQAEQFYYMGQGGEQFDGVVAITSNVLTSLLKLTGPVEVAGFPGTYGAESAVNDLEYQVEHGYRNQNIEFAERKSVMNLLGEEVLKRVKAFGPQQKYALFETMLDDLNHKDIQLFFQDAEVQARVEAAHWDGRVDQAWQEDYLMMVDANLSALKTDAVMKRSVDYSVDLSVAKPTVTLNITYKNEGKTKDWKTSDYQTFLRVYVPKGAWLDTVDGAVTKPVFGEELGKKYFGALVQVPLGTEKTVTFKYVLPEMIRPDYYDVKIQKQAGVNDTSVSVHVLRLYGLRDDRTFVLDRDWVFSESK